MEDVLLVFIIFGSIVAIVKLALDYAREKQRGSSSATGGSSLTSSELKAIMQEAVDDALDERFERFERLLEEMEEPRLIPASTKEADNTDDFDVSEVKPESPPTQRDRESLR